MSHSSKTQLTKKEVEEATAWLLDCLREVEDWLQKFLDFFNEAINELMKNFYEKEVTE